MKSFLPHRTFRDQKVGVYPHTNSRRFGLLRRERIRELVWGFTLIELLVVIAIIGILASIVLASLASARARARDARRLSELHELENLLALYYDSNNETYPTTLNQLVPIQIEVMYKDPIDGTTPFDYCQLSQNSYLLGASLEETNGATDKNFSTSATTCTTGGQDINGDPTGQCNSTLDPVGTRYCYNVGK